METVEKEQACHLAKDHLPSILRNILEAGRSGNELSDVLYLDHLKKTMSPVRFQTHKDIKTWHTTHNPTIVVCEAFTYEPSLP